MTLQEVLRDGTVPDAVRFVQEQVRKAPGQVRLRTQLFQLYCLSGEWERAQTQLDLMVDLDEADGELGIAAPTFRTLLQAETYRAGVMAGREKPLIMGEPDMAIAAQLEGNLNLARGRKDAAIQLFQEARQAATPGSGSIDEKPFSWIMDVDVRFGFMVEAVIGGKYYWIPFHRLRRIEFLPINSLHDQVWRECNLTIASGAFLQGYIPMRYPEAAATGDKELQLGRAAAWTDLDAGLSLGSGARFWSTDVDDYALRKTQLVELNIQEQSQ